MTCDCIKKIDEKLAEHNTRLDIPMAFPSGETFLRIATVKKDKKVRKGPMTLLVSFFCPFCGEPCKAKEAKAS